MHQIARYRIITLGGDARTADFIAWDSGRTYDHCRMERWRRLWQWRGQAGSRWHGLRRLAAGKPVSLDTLLLAVVVLGLAGRIALADGPAPPGLPTPPDETPGRADESSSPAFTVPPLTPAVQPLKMDGLLANVAAVAATSGDEAALATAQAGGLVVSGGMVRVLVETDNPDLSRAKAAIVAAGGTVEGEYADTIQALMPPAGLDVLAASPDVRYVRTPARPMPGRAG